MKRQHFCKLCCSVSLIILLTGCFSFVGQMNGGTARRISVDEPWNPSQTPLPVADEELLKKDPVLYYQIAHVEGRSVDLNEIVQSLQQLLQSEEAQKSAYLRLSYKQSLLSLGAATKNDVQRATVDFMREIAETQSPGVAIAMLDSLVPMEWLTQDEKNYFIRLAAEHTLHTAALPNTNALKPKLSKTEWFEGVVTVWVQAGFIVEGGLSIPNIMQGSGFFIDKKGYLITNYHVIAPYVEAHPRKNFFQISVEPYGSKVGFQLPAQIMGYHKETDLALLKVDDYTPKVVFSFASKNTLHTGDRVYTLGTPGSMSGTLTSGLISHPDRQKVLSFGNVIQMDAAVNPGNSGGPMLTEDGDIAGVVFAGRLDFQGVNFALSPDTVRSVLPLLMVAGGKSAQLPFVGLGMTEVPDGVEASLVIRSSLLEQATITEGAKIIKVAGMPVQDSDHIFADLQLHLLKYFANTLIEMVFEQNGKQITVLVRLTPRRTKPALAMMRTMPIYRLYGPMFGLVVKPLSSRMMYVQKVYAGSTAALLGIKPKDTLMLYQTFLYTAPGSKEVDALITLMRVTLEPDAGMPRNIVLAEAVQANYWL